MLAERRVAADIEILELQILILLAERRTAADIEILELQILILSAGSCSRE